ncbi:MAG: helix-turn-helix transcriptional regulator [Patescibacteria group bacterium]|jgi:transcriptional regulator with XRE-family HTH domain
MTNFIKELKKDKEFQRLYGIEKEKLDIAVALTKAREKRGMTQRQVAKKADLAWETVSRIENAKMNPSIDVLNRAFAAVGKKLKFQIS